jgi:hypothetical protein
MKVVLALLMLSFASISYAEEPAATPAATTPAAETAPAANSLSVEKIAVGTSVENRELMGTATEFDATVGKVYCWTKVNASMPPAKVRHLWSVDGQQEADVALTINYPSARTWSSKTVRPGQWKVEVADEAGTVLSSTAFTVKAESSAPQAQ